MMNNKRNFRGGNRRSGSSHSGAPSWKSGFGGQKINYHVRCDTCGNDCTVPFKPNGNKPVLCRDCFQTNDHGNDRRDNFRPFQKKSVDDRPTFQRVFDKPSFEKRSPSGPNLKEEIVAMNKKLDRILALLDTKEASKVKEVLWVDDKESDIE